MASTIAAAWSSRRLLVLGLDLPGSEHDTLRVGGVDAGPMQRVQRDHVAHVDPDRLTLEPALAQLVNDVGDHRVGHPGLDGHRTAHARDPCPPARLGQPRRIELMAARGRAEVPEDRVAVAAEQDEPGVLVPRPFADVRARHIADVVRVEQQQRAEIGCGKRRLRPLEPLTTQSREVDPLLPVDSHRRASRGDAHGARPFSAFGGHVPSCRPLPGHRP